MGTKRVQKEDPAIRAKMDACQTLIDKLNNYYNAMNAAKDKSFTDMGNIAPTVESDAYELSGDYYDEYVTYRTTWKTVFNTNYQNALSTLSSLGTRIDELKSIMADLRTKLMIWVEEEYDENEEGG